MLYASTRHNSPPVSFVEALWFPQAPDGGMYLPERLPTLPQPVINNMASMNIAEIAYVVFNAVLEGEMQSAEIKQLVDDIYNFPVPIKRLDNDVFVTELFGGPTLAFKDFGARATAAFLRHTSARVNNHRPVNVVIATTGNTGSAIANALEGAKNINVFILFPRGTATRALENQFTTPGGNIHAVEVNGSIDACYTLAATALGDSEFCGRYTMLSANSGNLGRLLGQMVYYFYAVSRVRSDVGDKKRLIVSVPAGNLGNLTAGVMANRMGLGVERFIACENSNDYLHRALIAEDFNPRAAVPTLAYAADKSVPTNLERILALFDSDIAEISRHITAISVTDPQIIEAVNDCYENYRYLLDTHSALAYYGLKEELRPYDNETGIVMATAHPAKSLTAMTAITGRHIELPLQLNRFMGREDHRVRIKPIYSAFRRIIQEANKK